MDAHSQLFVIIIKCGGSLNPLPSQMVKKKKKKCASKVVKFLGHGSWLGRHEELVSKITSLLH